MTQGTEKRTYRAETLEAALETAREEMGQNIRVVSANRMRRGGVMGFFATEIGVEVVVERSEKPSGVPEALEGMIRRTRDAADVNTAAVRREMGATGRDWAEVAAERAGVSRPQVLIEERVVAPVVASGNDEQARRDRENAEMLMKRIEERQNELLEDRVRERERAAQIAAERDAERHRAAKLEVEREKLSEEIVETREKAAEEIGRLMVEKEESERREHALRVEIGRLHGERDSLRRRSEILGTPQAAESAPRIHVSKQPTSDGVDVLERLSLPGSILERVRAGVPLAKAVSANGAKGAAISDQSGLVVLVGPGQLVLDRQRELCEEWGVQASECAYVTVRDLVQRESIGVRVLREEADIVSWVDGRRDPKKTAILAVEYNATPSWASALRRVSRAVPYGKWRLVLPSTYPLGEVRTLLTALVSHEPKIDLVGVRRSQDSARMLQFAEYIATVDGETHSGDLWASLLWERACQL